MAQATHYPAIFEEDMGTVGARFPQFPGCVSVSHSMAAAYHSAQEALALHLEGMLEDGEAIPRPLSWEALDLDLQSNEFPVLVEIEVPERVNPEFVRLNITMPKPLAERLIKAAGGNRSGWLAEAAREKLERDQRRTG